MNTAELRTKLEATMNGLLNDTVSNATAKEVANLAGKWINTIQVDLVGEELRNKLASFNHTAITLCDRPLEAEALPETDDA